MFKILKGKCLLTYSESDSIEKRGPGTAGRPDSRFDKGILDEKIVAVDPKGL